MTGTVQIKIVFLYWFIWLDRLWIKIERRLLTMSNPGDPGYQSIKHSQSTLLMIFYHRVVYFFYHMISHFLSIFLSMAYFLLLFNKIHIVTFQAFFLTSYFFIVSRFCFVITIFAKDIEEWNEKLKRKCIFLSLTKSNRTNTYNREYI